MHRQARFTHVKFNTFTWIFWYSFNDSVIPCSISLATVWYTGLLWFMYSSKNSWFSILNWPFIELGTEMKLKQFSVSTSHEKYFSSQSRLAEELTEHNIFIGGWRMRWHSWTRRLRRCWVRIILFGFTSSSEETGGCHFILTTSRFN